MSQVTLQQIIDAMRTHPLTHPNRDVYVTYVPDEPLAPPLTSTELDVYIQQHGIHNNYAAVFDARLATAEPLRPVQACAIGEAVLQLSVLAHDCITAYRDAPSDGEPPDVYNQRWYDMSDLIAVLRKCVADTDRTLVFKDSDGGGRPIASEWVSETNTYDDTYDVWTRAEYWYSYARADDYNAVPAFNGERPSRLGALLYAASECGFEVA